MSINNVEIQDSVGNVYYPHTDASVVKYGDSDVGSALLERVKQTTKDITYYISTTGSYTNDGLTSGTSFKTIQHAIDSLPQVINHTVIINIASGTYSEAVTVSGFTGKGSLTINGGLNNTDAVNYIASQFIIKNNACNVVISGMSANTTSVNAFSIAGNIYVQCIYCNCTVSSTSGGFVAFGGGFVGVKACIISNHGNGMFCGNGATIFSEVNSGTNNVTGLNTYGGTIIKDDTQPSGTTAETSGGGGLIR